jgi:hypothetical protein
MKKLAFAVAIVAAGALGASPAFAWHHHSHVAIGVGLGFGPYWGWPGPYYYPPAYYPPAVIVAQPAAPTQYVERAEQPQSGYWYYCETSRGYYPYVKDCPSGWKAVPPAPPPAQ